MINVTQLAKTSLPKVEFDDSVLLKLRKRREEECFPIINRGMLWYMKLSNEQHSQLVNWYNDWLDVTETLVVPNKPDWIDKKLENEEIIL